MLLDIFFTKAVEEKDEDFGKTYRYIRRRFEDLFGAGSWDKIPVPDVGGKAEPLPFGAKQKLTPKERARYTAAKKLLAAAIGMPTSGWGLYGRSIRGRLEEMMEDAKQRKKLESKAKKLKKKLLKKT